LISPTYKKKDSQKKKRKKEKERKKEKSLSIASLAYDGLLQVAVPEALVSHHPVLALVVVVQLLHHEIDEFARFDLV
jgi:hypothetical protein